MKILETSFSGCLATDNFMIFQAIKVAKYIWFRAVTWQQKLQLIYPFLKHSTFVLNYGDQSQGQVLLNFLHI
jgi:hypothetical protein